jgi:hypothetical protein
VAEAYLGILSLVSYYAAEVISTTATSVLFTSGRGFQFMAKEAYNCMLELLSLSRGEEPSSSGCSVKKDAVLAVDEEGCPFMAKPRIGTDCE